MAWIMGVIAVVGVLGQMSSANAAKSAGKDAQRESEYEAAQDRINAGQAMAAAQRDAMEEDRQGELQQSRMIAIMAAQGGGTADIGNVQMLAKQSGDTAYRRAVALYKGSDTARALDMRADASIRTGQSQARAGSDYARAGMFKAAGSAFSAGASLHSNYGGGGIAAEQSPAPVYERSSVYQG